MLWPHFIRDFTMVSVGQDVKENRTVKKGVLFGEFGYFLHNEHVLAIALNSWNHRVSCMVVQTFS